MDLKKSSLKALKALTDLKDIDRDDVLDYLGLEEKSTTGTVFGTIGIFALGCLVGAGLGLAFAPKPGNELRNDVTERLRRKAEDMNVNTDAFGANRTQMPIT